MLSPEILLTLKLNQQLFVDPRRIKLLKAIGETRSLSQAAKQIGMSYKSAWDSLNQINHLSPYPFVVTATGGKGGGGTVLSVYAERFIQLYELMTQLQINAFNILKDDDVPLDNILATTAKLSLQTSARNQLYATIKNVNPNDVASYITAMLNDNVTEMTIFVTKSSLQRLQLVAGKTVILLIKAPLIKIEKKNDLSKDDVSYQLSHQQYQNRLCVTVDDITQDNQWSEIKVSLQSGITMQVTKPRQNVRNQGLKIGDQIDLLIDPEHIVIAALV